MGLPRGHLPRLLAATTVTLALTLTTAPPGAAAEREPAPERTAAVEQRAPLWQSSWIGQEPDDSDIRLGQIALDPQTGDVLALAFDSDTSDSWTVRRIDGSTGVTESETPVVPPLDHQPAGPPTVTTGDVFHQWTGGRRGVRLIRIGLTGVVHPTARLKTAGTVRSWSTHPEDGRTCAVIAARRTAGRPAADVLACVDRSGAVLFERRLGRRGKPIDVPAEPLLAADPERQRWYVADARRQRTGVTTRVRAFDRHGKRLWSRARHTPGIRTAALEALTVDPRFGRVLLGSTDDRTRVTVWDRRGRSMPGKVWRPKRKHQIQDIVVTANGRALVAYAKNGHRIMLTALRLDGRQLWTRRHDRGGSDASLVLAEDRRQVLVISREVAAYDFFNGRPRWRGETEADYFMGFRGLYDDERGRFVVPWLDEGYPAAHVTAFSAGTVR